jgi:hypothetical protein
MRTVGRSGSFLQQRVAGAGRGKSIFFLQINNNKYLNFFLKNISKHYFFPYQKLKLSNILG